MNWLRQNWIKAGLVVVGLGALVFYLNADSIRQEAQISNAIPMPTPAPISSSSPAVDEDAQLPAESSGNAGDDCWERQMALSTSPKSSDARLEIFIENKKVDEVSILTVRTDMGKVIYHRSSTLPMFDPVFSPDDKKIYYRKPYATTSTAIYELDPATDEERYVTDGKSLLVIKKGKYVGKLIAERHKYYLDSGSYDWHWLIDPVTGEEAEVRPISNIGEFFDIHVCRYN